MKGAFTHSFFLLVFTVAIIVARPFIIYSSPVIRAGIEREAKVFGLARAVRKRSEYIYTNEEFAVADDQHQKALRFLLPFSSAAVRRWMQQLLLMLAFFLSYSLSRNRRIQNFFQLSPQDERYLSLSVIRI